MGKNFFDLDYPVVLAEKLQGQIQQVVDTKQILRDETPYIAPDGTAGTYEYIFVPVIGPDGSVEAISGSTRNITARTKAEGALRESEERFSAAFAHAPGRDGSYDASRAVCRSESGIFRHARLYQGGGDLRWL